MNKKLLSDHNIRLLFTTPSVYCLFVAKNQPHRAIVVSNRSGNYQLYAVDFNNGFKRQITSKKHGSIFGSISSNSDYIYILEDKKGNEYGHFVRIPFNGGEKIDITPGLEPYFSYSVSTSNNDEIICFLAATKNKNKIFIARKDKNNTYHPYEIYSTINLLSEPICSPDGSLVSFTETSAHTIEKRLIFLSIFKNIKITSSQLFDDIIPLTFSQQQNQKIILAIARRNNWYRPIMYNILKKRFTVINHPLFRGDVWVLLWDEANHQLVLCDVYHAEQKLYLYNINTKHLKRIGPKNGSFHFHFGSVAKCKDGSLIVRWSDFNNPPCLIAIHAPLYNTWSKIPEWSGIIKSHCKVNKIYIKSYDREKVQIWVALPNNSKTPLPFVIDVHGGPHSVIFNEFSPETHTWLANGFGYCAINYRGSISFGKKFEQKIYGHPGYWEVKDIVAARSWLVKNRYADPKCITLYGWSWGGYIVLLTLGKYPELWSSGIAGSSIGDFVTQYKDEPPYFKAKDKELFRGTPNTARKRYIRSSPLTYAKNIQSPILILHGKYDARCPPSQIKNFINILKKNRKKFYVVWFESGHIGEFSDTKLRIRLIKKALQFALKIQKK